MICRVRKSFRTTAAAGDRTRVPLAHSSMSQARPSVVYSQAQHRNDLLVRISCPPIKSTPIYPLLCVHQAGFLVVRQMPHVALLFHGSAGSFEGSRGSFHGNSGNFRGSSGSFHESRWKFLWEWWKPRRNEVEQLPRKWWMEYSTSFHRVIKGRRGAEGGGCENNNWEMYDGGAASSAPPPSAPRACRAKQKLKKQKTNHPSVDACRGFPTICRGIPWFGIYSLTVDAFFQVRENAPHLHRYLPPPPTPRPPPAPKKQAVNEEVCHLLTHPQRRFIIRRARHQ